MSQTIYLKVHNGRHKALPSTIFFMLLRPSAYRAPGQRHESRLARHNYHRLLMAGPVLLTATPRCSLLQLIAAVLDYRKGRAWPY